jgi:dephospho-CoA kinase
MSDKKIIIGFVGEIASGKDTAVAYLVEKYHASQYKFSDILRDILNRLYLELSRENLQKLSQTLRENFSQDILSKVIANDVQANDNGIVIVNGIRRASDIAYLKELPDFQIIHITADLRIRYERLVLRGENSDDKTKTFEQFQKDHEAEAELEIVNIAKQASHAIDNNGSFDELYSQLDALVEKVKN